MPSTIRLLIALLAGACAELAPEDGVAVEAVTCPVVPCGGNSPLIDSYYFHDLNLAGVDNAQGFRIAAFRKGSDYYKPAVLHGRLSGTLIAPPGGPPVIDGPNLEGAELVIEHTSGSSYALRINGVSWPAYWADANGSDPNPLLETYRLDWAALPLPPPPYGNWQNLCSSPPTSDNDTLGMWVTDALLFENDRIDAKRRTVSAGDDSWFNIGCAGNAISKLALTGHTKAAMADGFRTRIEDRQAMLKMLSGDYCGTGQAFTVAGIRLQWQDRYGWMDYFKPLKSIDARWTAAGAACLGVPRLTANPSPTSIPVFGTDVRPQILAVCPWLASCAPGYDDFHGTHLISANPW